MYYFIQDGSLIKTEKRPSVGSAEYSPLIGVHSYTQEQLPKGLDFLPAAAAEDIFSRSSFRFESHESFDLICFPLLNKDQWFTYESFAEVRQRNNPVSISYLFLLQNELHFCMADLSPVLDLLDSISKDPMSSRPQEKLTHEFLLPGSVLYRFFSKQTSEDLNLLEALEIGLNSLEEEVLTDHATKNYTRKFITIRKRLMRIKRYYEQLLEILGDVMANENAWIEKSAQQPLKLLSKKTDRLYQKTLNLMEYVSEIRAAYQAEVDISLNKTMKLLTIITVIVLPLTLIAGWYGMNFPMPEYQTPWGYPALILVSLLVVGLCIAYFKKHKWF